MNFEFANEKYWKDLTFDEAKMYCFSLTIDGKTGWRLPTSAEHALIGVTLWEQFNQLRSSCYLFWDSEGESNTNEVSNTIPVRDITDD